MGIALLIGITAALGFAALGVGALILGPPPALVGGVKADSRIQGAPLE